MAGRQNGSDKRVERTRTAILAAAEALFLSRGYAGTGMDQIAAAANLSKQTLYAHFDGKAALFVAVIEGMTGNAAATIRAAAGPPPDKPLADFLTDFATSQITVVLTPRLMRLRRLMIGEAERFPDLARALHAAGPGRSIALLTEAFRHYADRRVLLGDPALAAYAFNWLLMGGPTTDAMLLGDAGLPTRQQARVHVAETVRIFLAAYAA